MQNSNNIESAQKLLGKLRGQNVKYIRGDRSLIERKENEDKVVLVEDNRELLLG